MKKLLISPSKMALNEQESQIYQNILKNATQISLNLMAVKVEHHPEDFLGWCKEMHNVLTERLNFELLESEQLPIVKKMDSLLCDAISLLQLKTLRIAPWPIVSAYILEHQEQVLLEEHLRLAHYIDSIKHTALAQMSELDKHAFVGKHTAAHDPAVYTFDVEHFAGTRSSKAFHQLLADQAHAFDAALATIPQTGEVSQSHYQDFVAAYVAIFAQADEKPTLAPATRLLAMRRPDVFTPITASKTATLCAGLGVPNLNNQDFARYWQDIVCTLAQQPWFAQQHCDNELETQLAAIKALLPCLFFYFAKDAEQQSNYYKALNKPKRSSGTTGARRRSKESAEVLVERALAQDDVSDNLRNMKDAIVKEVEKGRSVSETIQLMRTIFG